MSEKFGDIKVEFEITAHTRAEILTLEADYICLVADAIEADDLNQFNREAGKKVTALRRRAARIYKRLKEMRSDD